MSVFKHNNNLYIKNLELILSNNNSLNPFVEHKCMRPGLCGIDTLVLINWLKLIGAKKVVEFGCGTTSIRMKNAGINVKSFSIGYPVHGPQSGIEFIKCDLLTMDKDTILSSINSADAIVIDCLHEFDFAKYYHENFLTKTDRPVWIHDVYNYETWGEYKYGEAEYLYKHVFNKTHEIFTMTDIPLEKQKLKEIFNIDIDKHIGRDKIGVCSVIINPY